MINDLIKKIKLVGGIEKSVFCNELIEDAFTDIEKKFNSNLPLLYKELYRKLGSFSFSELVRIRCIDQNAVMVEGNKVNVGDFYCITGNGPSSINTALITFQEQLPIGLLPICDGELGDIVCISLRKDDYGYIYYLHHEGSQGNDLFLIAKKIEDFIMALEINKGTSGDDELVKNMKMELSPQMIALLKISGYGPKNSSV
jgi:hypothetical protein